MDKETKKEQNPQCTIRDAAMKSSGLQGTDYRIETK